MSCPKASDIKDHIIEHAIIGVPTPTPANVGAVDLNCMIIDTDGRIVYTTDYDITITSIPLPRPVLG